MYTIVIVVCIHVYNFYYPIDVSTVTTVLQERISFSMSILYM